MSIGYQLLYDTSQDIMRNLQNYYNFITVSY